MASVANITGGQVVRFLCGHLGRPIASSALLEPIGNRFRREVDGSPRSTGSRSFSSRSPTARVGMTASSTMCARTWSAPSARAATASSRSSPARSISGSSRCAHKKPGARPNFEFFKEDRHVGTYYFYILDREFGPAFIKLRTYCPWPGKVWLNGHEWVKRQAVREGIASTELENGFAACSDPERLQAICNSLSPERVQLFIDRWIIQVSTP